MNIEEQIKEIIDMLFVEETRYKVNVAQSSTVSNTVPDVRSSPEYSAVNIVGKEAVIKLLTNLLTQQKEEAVREFGEWIHALPELKYENQNEWGKLWVNKYLSLQREKGEE